MPYPSPTLFPSPNLYPTATGFDPDAIGDEIYAALGPIVEMWGDPGQHLKVYSRALGRMIQPVDDFAKDGDGGQPGWSQAIDSERAKDEWLFWLGQWVGYLVPQKATTELQVVWSERERKRITTRSAHRRGTIAILREIIQEHLGGTKDVIIQERTSSPHQIAVWIYNNQIVTSAAAVTAAALSQKAAGLIMTFTILSGANYFLLQASNATYTIMSGKHATYNSVLTNPGL